MPDMSVVICPYCAWKGSIDQLGGFGDCPECGYENGIDPYRLLTLTELLQDSWTDFNDVRMGEFLTAILNHFGVELPKERNEDAEIK